MPIWIIENTPLGAPLPLSIQLAGVIAGLRGKFAAPIGLIAGQSSSPVPAAISEVCQKIRLLKRSTFSLADNLLFSLEALALLRQEHARQSIDVIHCLYPSSSLLAALLFKQFCHRRVKIIYDVRSPWIEMSLAWGYIPTWLQPGYRLLAHGAEKCFCRGVDRFMFITPGLAEYYRKQYQLAAGQKSYVSPTGIDLDRFGRVTSDIRTIYGLTDRDILIGSVGGITRERRPEEILHLFAPVIAQNPRVWLMLIGGRDLLTGLQSLARQLGISGRVIFTGNIAHEEMPRYISAFDFGLAHLVDIFIHQNNFSLKILEYLACGVPVLASRIQSNVAIARQLAGIAIYDSAEDILARLEQPDWQRLPTNLTDFSWSTLGHNYEQMYVELLGEGVALRPA
jgi:glycosyltransferase involved in cell wall biosynthesis